MKIGLIVFILTVVLFLAGSTWIPTQAVGGQAVVHRSSYGHGGYGHHPYHGAYHRPYPGYHPYAHGYYRPYGYRAYYPAYYRYGPYPYPYYYYLPPPPPVPYYPGW
jgi:hypothetical protein